MSSRGFRLRELVVAGALSVASAGCAGGDDPRDGAEAAAGELSTEQPPSNPSPLEEALKGTQPGTAERAVFRFIRDAKRGDLPEVVASYDPQVRRTVGADAIAGAYTQQRPNMVERTPKLIERRRSGDRVTLAVQFRRSDGSRGYETYIVRRGEGRWRVGYDTFLDRSISKDGEAAAVRFRRVLLLKSPPAPG